MNVSHVLGIDPGLSGAIALIQADTGELFDVADMPTYKTVTATGKKAYGVLVGLAEASGCHWSTIRPQEWKEWHPGLIGAGGDLKGHKRTAAIKTASRQAAMARFPYHADAFWRLRDDGRAEAALIADAYLRSIVARPVAA